MTDDQKQIIFKQITIIGLGLIGSSIARSVRENKLAGKIIGCDENEISLAFARKEGFVDSATTDMEAAVIGSNLVIIATPPATLSDIAEKIAPHLKNDAIVMDVASVKRPAMAAIAPFIPERAIFIPAHPIAGSEQSGVKAGRADLFNKKRIIITPEAPPSEEIVKKITDFWQGMGAKLEGMPADIHDMLYGYMSHLPQLLAFCAQKPLGKFVDLGKDNAVYQSFLRISNSNPDLWAEIFSENSANILPALDRYIDVVSHIQKELKNAPEEAKPQASSLRGEAEAIQIDDNTGLPHSLTLARNDNELLAYTVLFPRIVASCLITTVMEAEKNAGFSFAKYAGTGFADFSAPAIIAPEAELSQISAQYQLVAGILDEFIVALKSFRATLENTL